MNSMHINDDIPIGIVGGMGPEAGIALFNRILSHVRAFTDQEHLSVVLMSFPKHVADRTAFLEGAADINPAFVVAEIIGKLETAGARVIGIACNTCHAPGIFTFIQEELRRMKSKVRLLNMPVETCRIIREQAPHVRRVGFMVTNGTYRSQLYQHLLLNMGYEVVVPDVAFQEQVIHRMVYDPAFGIKAHPGRVTGQVRAMMEEALGFFVERKAEAVILGCTELSLIGFRRKENGLLIIDSMEALALALIREAVAPVDNYLSGSKMAIFD